VGIYTNVWETKQCLLVWVTTQFSPCKLSFFTTSVWIRHSPLLYSLVQHHLQACSQGCSRGLTKIYLLVSRDYNTCKACSCKPWQECVAHGGRKQYHCSERCYESSWKWWRTISALCTVSQVLHSLWEIDRSIISDMVVDGHSVREELPTALL